MEGIEDIKSLFIEESQLDIAFRKAPYFVQKRILEYDIKKLTDITLSTLHDGHWWFLSENEHLPLEIACKYSDKLHWWQISRRQDLSVDFIREFADKLDWWWISRRQDLSVDFIREFADKLDWWCLSLNHPISDAFVMEFADRVDREKLIYNINFPDLSDDVIDQLGMDEIFARIQDEESDDSGYEDDSDHESDDEEDQVAPPPGGEQ